MEIDIESNIMKVCTHTWSMGKLLSTDIMRMRGKEGEREREEIGKSKGKGEIYGLGWERLFGVYK